MAQKQTERKTLLGKAAYLPGDYLRGVGKQAKGEVLLGGVLVNVGALFAGGIGGAGIALLTGLLIPSIPHSTDVLSAGFWSGVGLAEVITTPVMIAIGNGIRRGRITQ